MTVVFSVLALRVLLMTRKVARAGRSFRLVGPWSKELVLAVKGAQASNERNGRIKHSSRGNQR
jgi:hypothetical protein